MPELEVRLIPPAPEAAEKIATAAQVDILAALERQGVDPNTLPARQQESLDESLSAITPERTLARIQRNPRHYYGAYNGDELVAAARLNTWNRYDQAPYENFLVGAALKGLARFRSEHLRTGAFGIHTLLAIDESHSEYEKKDGLDLLLKKAVHLAEMNSPGYEDVRLYNDLRIGIPAGDLLETSGLLYDYNFEPTEKYADGVAHVPVLRQELYIRQSVS